MNVLRRSREQDIDNEFIVSGIIGKFSLQFELGWKVLKELMRYEGAWEDGSPREIILRAAYQYDLIPDEDVWLSMLRDRNDAGRIDDGASARALASRIIDEHIPEFERLQAAVEARWGAALEEMS